MNPFFRNKMQIFALANTPPPIKLHGALYLQCTLFIVILFFTLTENESQAVTERLSSMFAVRIVTTDHYQGPPIPGLDVQYADFRASVVKKVPVIRVFGSTPQGMLNQGLVYRTFLIGYNLKMTQFVKTVFILRKKNLYN